MHVKKRLQVIFILVMINSISLFAGEYYYHLHDHLGCVRVVVDKNANVVEAFDYYPFGAELRSTVNNNQAANLRFTGKELDKESHIGLYYFGARYYDAEVGRFISVDPLADLYPHMTPYHYALNNPMQFIDPTGMWVASYDSSGNIVNVTAEEGDNLEGLYSQLGITADQFAEQYGISNMANYSVIAGQTAFNITNYVVANTNFTFAGNNANCHGFVSTALGLVPGGTQVSDAAIVNNLGNQTTNPNTGNVAVFNNQGQYGFPPEQLRNMNGVPGHSALFIVNNSAGQAQYLNRLNTGRPVTANTQSQIVNYFSNTRNQALNMAKQANIPLVMPTLNPTPIFYRRK